ncbi:MAG: DUF423 domain-containing protein [Calditrichia bacterium]
MALQSATQLASRFATFGAIHAFFAVALGAFGAHLLQTHLTEKLFTTFKTATYYHLTHAIVLLFISFAAFHFNALKQLRLAGNLIHAGILLFCGSLYSLSLSGITWLGAITPLGGLCFLAGWIMLLFTIRQGFLPASHSNDS